MKKVILIVVISLCCQCSPKILRNYSNAQKADSLIVREKVIVKEDTIYVPIPMQSESIMTRDTSSHLETDFAQSDAVISDGMLSHKLSNKPQELPAPIKVIHYVHDTVRIVKEVKTEVTTEPIYIEKELKLIDRLQILGFKITVALLVCCLLFKYVKPLIRIVRKFLHL